MDSALVMACKQVGSSGTDRDPGNGVAGEARHLSGRDLPQRCARLSEQDTTGQQVRLDRAKVRSPRTMISGPERHSRVAP